ncbi:MAG: acyltransferase [Microcystis sp. LE19-4.1E]|nr:acyltransferase [Microcystis sp. LE19-4.1E]
MNSREGQRFIALDAWRGIAALLVALYRLEADGFLHGLQLIQNAWLFVDFFFVLSGFVIAHAYLDRIESGSSVRVFVIRRFGRVWPLHAVLLFVFVFIELARFAFAVMKGDPSKTFVDGKAPITILWDLMLVQAIGFTGTTLWNTPAWSISTEFWTYIVFAILCLGGRKVVMLAAPAIVASGLWVVGSFSPNGMDTTFQFGFARCLAGFFTGVMVLMLWRRYFRTLVLGNDIATLLEAAAITIVGAFVATVGRSQWTLLAPFVFAMIVIVFAFQRGRISQALASGIGRLLGDLSYSIYMTALLVSLAFNKAPVVISTKIGHPVATAPHIGAGNPHTNFDLGPTWLNDAYTLLYLAVVIMVSWVTFRCIEVPARNWFNQNASKAFWPFNNIAARDKRLV